MSSDPAVPDVRWDTDPRLIVGWREGKTLTGRRVGVDQTVFDDFRDIASKTIATLTDSEARPYEPHAKLDAGEQHFTVPIADLPSSTSVPTPDRAAPAPAPGAASPETAGLLSITGNPDGLELISAQALDRHTYLFYGLVFDTADGQTVTFLRKADPVRLARSSRLNLSGRSTLYRAEAPALTLLHDIDLVTTATHLLVLRKSAFDQILNDVKVALQDVPANITKTETALASKLPLGPKATDALTSVGAKRPSYAVRLRTLADRIAHIDLTPERVEERLTAMGNKPADLLDGDTFSFPAARVGLFLDLLEGRHFDDEWTGERMKADRMSRHTPG